MFNPRRFAWAERPLSEYNDDSLVAIARAGGSEALGALIERHRAGFVRHARGLLGSDADAEEVVQTASLKMYTKLDTLRPDAPWRAWAYRVLTNTALMRLRRRKVRRAQPLSGAPIDPNSVDYTYLGLAPAPALTPEDRLNRDQIRALLRRSIEELPARYREVVEMRTDLDLPLAEVARRLELSVPAVKTRLHRARAMLKVSLEVALGPKARALALSA